MAKLIGALIFSVIAVVVALVLVAPTASVAIEPSYDCLQIGDTNIGWNNKQHKFTAGVDLPAKQPITVKLSALDTDRPLVTSQNVGALQRVHDTGIGGTWFVEWTSAGGPHIWALFPRSDTFGGPRTATLINTKVYSVIGSPMSFTSVYSCSPNMPGAPR